MKRFSIWMVSLFVAISAMAANYTVTVSTRDYIEFRDEKTDEVIQAQEVPGQTFIFEVSADTPRDAEDQAINRCNTACHTGMHVKVATKIAKNGHVCDKYKKTVVYQATAKLN